MKFITIALMFTATMAVAEPMTFEVNPTEIVTVVGLASYLVLPNQSGVIQTNGCSGYYNRFASGRYLTFFADMNSFHSFDGSKSITVRMEFKDERDCLGFEQRFLNSAFARIEIQLEKHKIAIELPAK